MELQNVAKALEKNRYDVKVFETKEEAAAYLDGLFDNMVIGFGDSQTMVQMGLHDKLAAHNMVIDPYRSVDNDDFLRIAKDALTTEVFLTSVNGMTEDGVLINLDGTGNRVAGSLFGHKKVYFIVGKNKIAPDMEQAIWRVRNIAAPQNARRLKLRTPCAVKADKCYNCASPDRICNGLMIMMKKMNDMDMEVILINEELGY